MLPWRRLCERTGAQLVVVPVDALGRVSMDDYWEALGPRVRVAAIAHISNVLGTVNPVRDLVDAAHRAGATVVVDGAQAVPHRRVDVRALDVDFYCFSGHKAYGPMGIGVLYGRRDLLGGPGPLPSRWRNREGRATRQAGRLRACASAVRGRYAERRRRGRPRRGSATTSTTWAWRRPGTRRDASAPDGRRALSTVERVRVVGDPTRDPSGIVSFTVDGIHPYDVGGHLDAHGIAVR